MEAATYATNSTRGFCTRVGDDLYFWSPEAAAKRPKLAQAGIEARTDLAFGRVYKIDLPAPERSCRSYPCLAASCRIVSVTP